MTGGAVLVARELSSDPQRASGLDHEPAVAEVVVLSVRAVFWPGPTCPMPGWSA